MGAWGHGSFQNDHARDWCSALRRSQDPTASILSALSARQTEADEVRLLAAAEVVAALGGAGASSDTPPNITKWIEERHVVVNESMRELARSGVEAIRHKSALHDLWQQAGELANWHTVVDQVLRRLTNALPAHE